jgi:multiple sugar transport system substrate-binding protein
LTGSRRDAAIDFARYLISPETSSRICGDRGFPMLPVRTSQLVQGFADPRSAPGVSLRQWSEAVGRTLAAERVVPGLRIPSTGGYLADLADGRQEVLRGEPPGRALDRVSGLWSKRAMDLGTDRQLWHYRRSLNALATLPEPPRP